MDKVLQDLSPPALVRAIEASMLDLYRNYGRSPLAELDDRPDLLRLTTGVPVPVFNAVVWARFTTRDADERIAAALAPFRERRVAALWWIGPSSEPPDLGARLQRHGLTPAGDEPGMAADLATLPEPPPLPRGVAIEPAADERALARWVWAFSLGFGIPESLAGFHLELERSLGVDPHGRWRRYLAVADGEPAAVSAALLGAGVVGLYDVATRPQHRRRGLGTALTLQPLLEARALGYRAAVLQASPEGERLYRRLGFREYCRVYQYLWSPRRQARTATPDEEA